ncbi:cytochrome C biogenesis protein [Candidatus Woesearchaeota archaeon]|jgi:cytochrome c-type biogenesis protein|nr:cytochrome C biogenesis protein [Candidatus Woesearchaeota archaeon]MBT4150923.1 cytochrome C biogenesis protein [Candidatus Woesearchaeota archaeon]MBT4247102.1 cytochrome C biogenesis protein [Candidatus Woesearchaeota archaeon]MBT4433713.1 cytochrome C biogenesis protein [Candidatus Woesearchaeota archaeon]
MVDVIGILSNLPLIGSLFAGLFAPLGAVCVLPLYPGFLSYLAGQLTTEEDLSKKIKLLGIVVTLGVILSMGIVGLIFTLFLQDSLTEAIGIISPIAFGILAIASLFLIFNFDLGRFFPKVHAPVKKNPYLSALIFGLFFGAIVLPCNPASLIVLFALTSSVMSFFSHLLNFILFGFGMALPLLIFSWISAGKSKSIIGWLTTNKKAINITAGIIMLAISLYYLIIVFRILG